MQNAETVLSILRECGAQGLPLDRLYRQLFNPSLYLHAYGKIYRNTGAMTPGVTSETVDGMALTKIDAIIQALRMERYQWTPVRRIYIEKKRSKKLRPLGLPTWSDKLLQEVMRLLLEAYFEPRFSTHAHGFRPGRGCHTALSEIYHSWVGTTWLIEGDIAQCFDCLDHATLLSILSEDIYDGRFLHLVETLLRAGYLENWRYHATYSGSPQGSILSPILANIYLAKLDRYVETTLIPAHTRGDRRHINLAYRRLYGMARRRKNAGHLTEAAALRREMQRLPSLDPADPSYRRLRYIRYADDVLLGFVGPRQEAEEIKRELGVFLHNTLHLTLSEEKTLITHARTQAARFLGYDITVLNNDHKRDQRGHRSINGQIALMVPRTVIQAQSASYLRHGAPTARKELTHDTVYSIMAQFQAVYRGVAEYYQLATNRYQLNRLKWVMERSLTGTLAEKLRIHISQVYHRYETLRDTPEGPRKALQVTVERGEGKRPLVAYWGGISLARRMHAVLNDAPPFAWGQRTELEKRLLADTCERCGSHDNIQVHHIRALKDLRRHGRKDTPGWMYIMAARRRKTLVVCEECHVAIHAGRAN